MSQDRLVSPFYCFYCGRRIKNKKARSTDHIISKSKNGADNIFNKIRCCTKCNNDKDSLSLENYKLFLERRIAALNWLIPLKNSLKEAMTDHDRYKE